MIHHDHQTSPPPVLAMRCLSKQRCLRSSSSRCTPKRTSFQHHPHAWQLPVLDLGWWSLAPLCRRPVGKDPCPCSLEWGDVLSQEQRLHTRPNSALYTISILNDMFLYDSFSTKSLDGCMHIALVCGYSPLFVAFGITIHLCSGRQRGTWFWCHSWGHGPASSCIHITAVDP